MRAWHRRLVWRLKILGFVCGACFGVAFVSLAGEPVEQHQVINWLWVVLAGVMGVAGFLINWVISRLTQRVDLHDTKLDQLSALPTQVARIDLDVQRLIQNSISKSRWDDFVEDWREYKRTSTEWREKIEAKIDGKADKIG